VPISSRKMVPPLASSNFPHFFPDCAGESPLLVAEQFAFDERVRHGAAVHADELRAGPVAVLVDQFREDRFAGAVSPDNMMVVFVGAADWIFLNTSAIAGLLVRTTSSASVFQNWVLR
jgi:hypothetical protein